MSKLRFIFVGFLAEPDLENKRLIICKIVGLFLLFFFANEKLTWHVYANFDSLF